MTQTGSHPLILKHGLTEEYPFSQNYLTTSSGIIHFVDEGQGPVLLFVHGNPTWSFAWRNLIKRFSKTHRCIAIDHLGCGLSDKPQQEVYRLADHIERLQLLVETLDLEKITLIAHDWGGAIGSGVAGRLPQRFDRLVLLNTGAFRSQLIPFRIALCRIPLLGKLGMQGANLFAQAAVRMAVNEAYPLPEKIKKGYLLPYDSWKNRIAIDRFVKDIPLKLSHPSYPTLTEVEQNLSKLSDKPVLLPWGIKDWCFTPEFLKEFQQIFPEAQTVRFEKAGHYLFEERPQELGDAIEKFLGKTENS